MEIRMGIYLNPGNEEFQKALNSKIYVDKTMLISEMNRNLNTEHQNICVTTILLCLSDMEVVVNQVLQKHL